MNKHWITGIVLAALAGCGPLQGENRIGNVALGLVSTVTQIAGGESDVDAAPGVPLTRAEIESHGGNLLRLSIIDREAVALLAEGARNGSKITWISPDGIAIVMDRGLLIGTRGLGDDLMGSDIAAANASLVAGGSHTRTLDFLDGLGRIERQSFRCTTAFTAADTLVIFERSYATRKFTETCTGESFSFTNLYWRDTAGVIWQSRQWISPLAGYLGYQRL